MLIGTFERGNRKWELKVSSILKRKSNSWRDGSSIVDKTIIDCNALEDSRVY